MRCANRCVRSAPRSARPKIDPDLLTAAETIQYEGYLRREETNAAILGLAKDGVTIKEIVRRTGYSRGLVRKVLRGQRSDVFRVRESSLEVHLPWLDAQWAVGRRNGAELWRQLKQQGFRGCLRVVSGMGHTAPTGGQGRLDALSRAPSARTIARLMTIGRDRLSKSETVIVAAIEAGVPSLVRGSRSHRRLPGHDPKEILGDLDPLAAASLTQLGRVFRQRRRQGQSSGQRRDLLALVQRPNRRSNHQAEARQTPDVRARKARPAASPRHRRSISDPSSKLRQSPKGTPYWSAPLGVDRIRPRF